MDKEVDDLVDAAEDEMPETMEGMRQYMLPWRSRSQVLLALSCNRVRMQPQCLCHQGRETELAPSWPVQSAGGAVGTSWASRPKGV